MQRLRRASENMRSGSALPFLRLRRGAWWQKRTVTGLTWSPFGAYAFRLVRPAHRPHLQPYCSLPPCFSVAKHYAFIRDSAGSNVMIWHSQRRPAARVAKGKDAAGRGGASCPGVAKIMR